MKIHPMEEHIIIDAIVDKLAWKNAIHNLDTSYLDMSDLEFFMERERLRSVESALYFYLEFFKGGRLCFLMRFPFVNRRDWVDIIAETYQMDYQLINLTAKPDENIELWNISTEFYPLKSLPPEREDIMLQLEAHGTKPFENTNIMVTIISMYELPSGYLFPRFHKKVQQFWKGYIQFSNQNLIHVISLQGKYKEVSMQNMEKNTNASLNVLWLEISYQKFHSYRDAQFACSCRNHNCLKHITLDTPLDGSPNLNFAFIYQNEKNTTYKGTWLEAYELCKEFDGYLPIFHSREVVDQLISVLKLPQVPPPPIKFMFIC